MRLPAIRVYVLAAVLALSTVAAPAHAVAPADPPQDTMHPLVMKQAADQLAAEAPPNSTAGSKPAPLKARTELQGLAAPGAGGPRREVFGFAYMNSGINDPSVGYSSWNFDLLSTVAVFGIHVNWGDGSLSSADVNTWHSSLITNFISYAHSKGTRVVATVIMQDFSGGGGSAMCQALANRATTVGQITQQVAADGVEGLNVDYEGLNGTCSNGQSARAMMSDLVQRLRAAMPGTYLSVDTYGASASDPYNFFDVPSIGASADALMVMAYDQDFSNYGYPPLNCSSYCLNPVGALNAYHYNDTSEMAQYSAAIPASKVILGIPYYGRGACVAAAAPNQYPTSSTWTPSYQFASSLQSSSDNTNYAAGRDVHEGSTRLDTWKSGTPNCIEEMYWDDVLSLGGKYDLVNSDNLRGIGIWTLPYGGGAPELWGAIATHFTNIPGPPASVSACAGDAAVAVSWTPAASPYSAITGYRVTASPGGATVTVGASARYAAIGGLTPGTAYTISVQALNAYGAGIGAGAPGTYTPASTLPSSTSYLSWYDRATPGMASDNVHLVDPGASGASGCVSIAGVAVVPFSVAAGQETWVQFPTGTIGGPVQVSVYGGPPVLASQRVLYSGTFNEVAAQPASAASTQLYLTWYDAISPGFSVDNVHVINPGPNSAPISVGIPGCAAQIATLAAGAESFFRCSTGYGGPVTVSSSGNGVLASQRVVYNQSFNEVIGAAPGAAAASLYLTWFDQRTTGFAVDNVHVVNPGPGSASVTVGIPGCSSQIATLAPGTESFFSCQAGYGGPVTVTSSGNGVLASQRVEYYQTFNEVAGQAAGAAQATRYLAWYDHVTPGMSVDNVHVVNPGPSSASVSVAIPGCPAQPATVAGGAETYFSCATGYGGPVVVSSSGNPVLASQRVAYYQSFNEVLAGP